MLPLHKRPLLCYSKVIVQPSTSASTLSNRPEITMNSLHQHSSSLILFLRHRWLTGCWFVEFGHSLRKISAASHHPLPPQPPLLFPAPGSPPQPGSPSCLPHALCLAPFLTPPAGKSPSTFRTTKTSQRGSSTANCPCSSISMPSE